MSVFFTEPLLKENNMEYQILADSELKVSRICFGGEQLGGFALGHYDINNTIKAAEEGIERGINFFDTADCYGLGESERNLSKIISGRRDKIIVSSKFGVQINPTKTNRVSYNNTSAYIDLALEASLNRLKTDYIDLYQVHYWDGYTPLEDVFTKLERLCELGKIRYYGVSNFDCDSIIFKDFPNLVSFSYEYSLANRQKENTIQNHLDKRLSFLAFGGLGQGVLSGKYTLETEFSKDDRRSNEKYVNFHGNRLKKNLQIVSFLRDVSNSNPNMSVAQLALRWVIEKYPQSVLISGIKNTTQLNSNVAIFDFSFSQKELDRLDFLSH